MSSIPKNVFRRFPSRSYVELERLSLAKATAPSRISQEGSRSSHESYGATRKKTKGDAEKKVDNSTGKEVID